MRHSPESVARVCYAALSQLREEQGWPSAPAWAELVREEQGWYVRMVERAWLGLLPRQIHDEWRCELEEEGWKPGDEIDHDRKRHPELDDWPDLAHEARDRFRFLQVMIAGMEFSHIMGGLSFVTAK